MPIVDLLLECVERCERQHDALQREREQEDWAERFRDGVQAMRSLLPTSPRDISEAQVAALRASAAGSVGSAAIVARAIARALAPDSAFLVERAQKALRDREGRGACRIAIPQARSLIAQATGGSHAPLRHASGRWRDELLDLSIVDIPAGVALDYRSLLGSGGAASLEENASALALERDGFALRIAVVEFLDHYFHLDLHPYPEHITDGNQAFETAFRIKTIKPGATTGGTRDAPDTSPKAETLPDGLARLMGELRSLGVHIAILPELVINDDLVDVVRRHMNQGATELPAIVVAGSFHRPEIPTSGSPMQGSGGRFFNTAPVIGRGGVTLGEHRKTSRFHLTSPGGEGLIEGIEPARSLLVIETAVGRLAISICKDFLSHTDGKRLLEDLDINVGLVPSMTPAMQWFHDLADIELREFAEVIGVANTPSIELERDAPNGADNGSFVACLRPSGGRNLYDRVHISRKSPAGGSAAGEIILIDLGSL